MIPPIRHESTGISLPTEKPKNAIQAMRENLDILRESGASPEEIEREIRKWGRVIQNINDREQAATPQSVGEAMAPALSSAFDAGTFGLAGLATDALSPGDFRTNRDMRQRAYREMSTSDRVLSSLAGGLANPVNRLIPGSPAAGAGVLRTAGRGMLEGAAQGAATGFGENVGTTEGAGNQTLAGALLGGAAGGVLAPVAGRLARGKGTPERDALRRALTANEADVGNVAPAPQPPMQTGRLAREVPQQTPIAPVRRGMPTPMAIDEAGPVTVANARGATGTVPGREAFKGPFTAREQQMAPEVTFDAPDAVAIGNRLDAERSAVAKETFGDAVEETKGEVVDSDLLQDILRTPMGQKAWRAVVERRPNRVVAKGDPNRALPTIEREVGGAPNPNALYEVGDTPFGPRTETETVPDAEAIHEIKRQLSEWASLDPNTAAASGVDAIGANDALGLFGRLRAEMPVPFQNADDAYASASRPIDALTMGRQPWKNNPNPASFKSEQLATTNALERYGAMPPEEQAMVRTGKHSDVASRINEGTLTPSKAVKKMDKPGSALARELQVVGGELPQRLRAWDQALSRQSDVLPTGQIAIEPTANTPLAAIAEIAAPTLPWMTAKAGRMAVGKTSLANLAERGLEDAEFGRLMTGRPESLADALANLALKDKKVKGAVSRTTGTAGRTAGGSQ